MRSARESKVQNRLRAQELQEAADRLERERQRGGTFAVSPTASLSPLAGSSAVERVLASAKKTLRDTKQMDHVATAATRVESDSGRQPPSGSRSSPTPPAHQTGPWKRIVASDGQEVLVSRPHISSSPRSTTILKQWKFHERVPVVRLPGPLVSRNNRNWMFSVTWSKLGKQARSGTRMMQTKHCSRTRRSHSKLPIPGGLL